MIASSEVAVSVHNLTKSFRIYKKPGDRLREVLSISNKSYSVNFTALKDVSFEVKKGEFLGIVGKNGAGKSTLLKLISKQQSPTSGKIESIGKVSLLQLGVGFDPELSGIQNALFSMRLMGLPESDYPHLLKEIEDFADIGEFIHHPVKTYSSGMHSRLSFAIAINIDPDILIADEVLAVGDLRFSQKCLRKMQEFKDQGKTIILVTHDVSSISAFCDRAIWLRDGEIFRQGLAKSIAEEFRNFMLFDLLPEELVASEQEKEKPKTADIVSRSKVAVEDLSKLPQITDSKCIIKQARIEVLSGNTGLNSLFGNEKIKITLEAEARVDISEPHFGIIMNNEKGLIALHTNNKICNRPIPKMKAGQSIVAAFEIMLPELNNGKFTFSFSFGNTDEMNFRVHDACPIEIIRFTDEKERQFGYVIITQQDFTYNF